MTDTEGRPKLVAELASIEQWRLERADAYDKNLVELAAKEQELREQLAQLQQTLQENADKQAEVKGEAQHLPGEVVRRSHQALLDALAADKDLVDARATALQEVRELALVELQDRLEEPDTAAAIEEYEKFREVEPVLGSLPPSYRQVVMNHHEELKTKLAPLFELASGPTEPLEVDEATAVLVASIDIVDGKPAAFALFLPVDFQVYRGWADRPEDLSAQLAYRVVSGVSRALDKLGAPDAPVVYQDFNGCISIQVWLDDHDLEADVAGTIAENLRAALAEAPECEQAKLAFEVAWVEPGIIGPEEEEQLAEPDESVPAAEGDEAQPEEEGLDVDGDDKKFKPVQIVLRRGGSDQW